MWERAARSDGSGRWARPTSMWPSPVLSPDAERLEAIARRSPPHLRAATRRRSHLASGLLPAADRAHVVRVQRRDRPAGHRGQWHPGHQPPRGAHQELASSSSATPTKPAPCRRCPSRKCSVGTGPTSPFESSTPGWPLTVSTCGPAPQTGTRRSDWAPRWWAAGKVAPLWHCAPITTTLSSVPTRSETTGSSTRTTRAASAARPGPTPGAPTPVTPWTATET